jgi:hypothetical protein
MEILSFVLQEELEETLVMLAVRDRELTKVSIPYLHT